MSTIDATVETAPLKEITMAEITLLDLDRLRCDEDIQTREVREGEALDLSSAGSGQGGALLAHVSHGW